MHNINSGLLVSFEGTEGAGKSTLVAWVGQELKGQGFTVTLTREPGGTLLGEKIRTLILDHSMSSLTELFLYEAARSEHCFAVIRPALARGEIVLCDRFTDSTLAYQAYARGLPWQQVSHLNQIATQGLSPHLTVLLDIDPEFGLKRVVKPNRFEEEGVNFQIQVREGLLKARKEDPKRWLTLNALKFDLKSLGDQVIESITARKKEFLGH